MTVGDSAPGSCSADRTCITCSDEGRVLLVLSVDSDGDIAVCVDTDGRETEVEVALVGPIGPGDQVLVHAGVALLRLDTARRGAA